MRDYDDMEMDTRSDLDFEESVISLIRLANCKPGMAGGALGEFMFSITVPWALARPFFL